MTNKGLLTDEQKKELKASNPGTTLFITNYDKKNDVVFQHITYPLLQKVTDLIKDSELQGKGLPIKEVNDLVFDTCVVWPKLTHEEKDNLVAGAIPQIVKSIQEKSGFIDIDIFQRVLAPDVFTKCIQDYDNWGDLPDEQVEKLKEDNQPFSLFRTRIGKFIFVIRPMTRIDIQISSQSDDDQLALAKCVTVWPPKVDWDKIPGGIIEVLVRECNACSGWSESAEVEEL